jgi:hypothetical protein
MEYFSRNPSEMNILQTTLPGKSLKGKNLRTKYPGGEGYHLGDDKVIV